jgi:hypothetical protein
MSERAAVAKTKARAYSGADRVKAGSRPLRRVRNRSFGDTRSQGRPSVSIAKRAVGNAALSVGVSLHAASTPLKILIRVPHRGQASGGRCSSSRDIAARANPGGRSLCQSCSRSALVWDRFMCGNGWRPGILVEGVPSGRVNALHCGRDQILTKTLRDGGTPAGCWATPWVTTCR